MLILTMSMVHGGDDKSVKPVNNGGDYDNDDDIGVDDGVSEDGIRFSTMSPGLHQQLLSSPQVLPPTRTTTQSTGFMRSDISDQIYTSMKILMCQLNVKLGIVTKTQRK